MIVVFGAPDPIDDHAERALRCAIAMQRRQAQLNAEGWGTDAVDGLYIGVGVNTGQVIAGVIGGGGRLEYTVIGDAVNVAPSGCRARRRAARSWRARPRSPRRPACLVRTDRLATG